MMKRFLTALALAANLPLCAQTPLHLEIDPHTTVAPVSPTLYGLMTEEINYSYDGGLYAEMVRNRTFRRDWAGYEHWTLELSGSGRGRMEQGEDGPSKALPKSLRFVISAASAADHAGVANDGWWGFALKPSTTYDGSFYARAKGPSKAIVRLEADNTGAVLAEATVPLKSDGWDRYAFTLKTSATMSAGTANHLSISFTEPGEVELQLISLFPPTFHNRVNGFRPDLMEMMSAMKPHFLRLPGGNYLEGDTIKERFNWKETIGPLVDRPTHRSPWNYQSSDGMGLLEFLEWCEDLKIEPVLAVYAGYSLKGEKVLGNDLEPYVKDALDEIEYVTGDAATTTWGARRAKDGHPAAFPLHYVEIGNEDWLDHSKSYDERYPPFAKAIRARYPQLKLIATTPVKKGDVDVVDDHYYESPEQFYALVHKYDSVDRNGPKIFVGEWATRQGSPTPNFSSALGDAAWMTGMERNSDLIVMASYAPLFVNVNPGGMQWSTDLIGYDAAHAYGSPSYWAQVMFANHLGAKITAVKMDKESDRFFSSATVSADGKMLHLKLVNASDRPQALTLTLAGVKAGPAKSTVLHAGTPWATNSIEHPHAVEPRTAQVAVPAGAWSRVVPGNTIEVLDLPLR